jgi:hypothetical protein
MGPVLPIFIIRVFLFDDGELSKFYFIKRSDTVRNTTDSQPLPTPNYNIFKILNLAANNILPSHNVDRTTLALV